ncbi:hypothetical protein COV56_03710 [Candidatus Kuenenbacteria bacterium CG11_big_fil_rev_8_21_14_0_20_37_9]|nr:MAG: hypothetical protein COV56_03710 [Candidatus Kuenenbacteria bacterium CG11_big_fil_rev_8_21_14_0_20_37_9]
MPDNQSANINICSSCAGEGLVGNQKCKNCSGYGTILLLNNKIFFWGKKYSRLKIVQEKQAQKIRVFINLAFFLFGVAGLFCIVKALFDFGGINLRINEFMVARSEYTLVFWISLFSDMYLVYRISRESKIKYLVEKKQIFSTSCPPQKRFDWNNIKKYKKVDIFRRFDAPSQKIVADAWLMADKLNHALVADIHLFASSLANSNVNLIFSRLGVDYQKMAEKIKRALHSIAVAGKTRISPITKKNLLKAYYRAYAGKKKKVRATDIIFALASEEDIVKEILYDLLITDKEIAHVVEWVDFYSKLMEEWHRLRYRANFKPKNAMNRAYTAVATPNLNQISEDMTLMARAGVYDLCVNRQKEKEEIFMALATAKAGAILVGQPGIGKRTIIEAIAELMVEEDVPKEMKDKRLVSLSASSLVAGASKEGDLEARIIVIINEIARAKNIILFIEDIHHLVGLKGDSGRSMDMAEVLAEQIMRSNFLILATTTIDDYQKYIENSSLAKTLRKIIINEPTQDETIRILEAKALRLEALHKIYFSYQSIEQIATLSGRYLHDEYQPEKAIGVLEEVALNVKQSKGEKAIVNSDDVASIISVRTNIPAAKIAKDERGKLLNLEQKMHERVIGQDNAISLVASALRRARTELRSKNRPIASFLFLGPTGVGKTEVAKTLAETYFGEEKNMIRLDMSEYQSNDAMTKLIGSADTARVGYLTEAVRKNPFSLVLLDEIEKASFDILNIFLQVFDDGRLTDAIGKTIDFTNSIIIATSNAGADFIQQEVRDGASMEKIRDGLIGIYLKDKFRPEFLNRFDGIVVFHPLATEHVRQIAKLFLNQLAQRLEEKGVKFKITESAIYKLAELGFEPTMGARPLRRVIQDRVEDQLAKLFLDEKIKRRDEIILGPDLIVQINRAPEI